MALTAYHHAAKPRPRALRCWAGRAVAGAVLAGLVALSTLVGYWALSGGRWFIVETPSMGQAAPVGTLLWVKSVPYDQLRVGEIISFRPPSSHTIYTHRILSIRADGTITTKGDINGSADPWRLSAANVIGRVYMRWWGLGWVVKAGPILLIGGAVLWGLVWLTPRRWRLPGATVGFAVLVSLSVFVTKPLTRGELVDFSPLAHGARATYVSTGLLPVRLIATGSPGHVDLLDGQVGSISATHANDQGEFVVHLDPHLNLWLWMLIAGLWLLPALWSTAAGETQLARAQ